MNITDRPTAPHPDEALPGVPTFTVTSSTAAHLDRMPHHVTAAGGSTSPHLAWSGFPAETQSFMVTCFDPDAPVPSGYWHWCIVDIPEQVTELNEGAGTSDLELDGPAFHLRGDHGEPSFFGAAPPAGDRPHRYVFTVYALDVDTLGVDDDTTIATASFIAIPHVIARASLTWEYSHPTR